MSRLVLLLPLLLALPSSALAQQPPAARLADRTAGLTRADGFVPFYWDAARGRVLMEVPAFDEDVLYYVSAATGGGSVEMSFDRGIMSSSVIHFQRSARACSSPSRTCATAPSAATMRWCRTSGLVPDLGAGRAADRGGRGRARARRRHAAVHARRRRRRRRPAGAQSGPIASTRRAALLPGAHEGLPRQHRDRDGDDLRRRATGPPGHQRDAERAGVHDAHPPLVPAGADRLHAAPPTAHRRQLGELPRLHSRSTRAPRCRG